MTTRTKKTKTVDTSNHAHLRGTFLEAVRLMRVQDAALNEKDARKEVFRTVNGNEAVKASLVEAGLTTFKAFEALLNGDV